MNTDLYIYYRVPCATADILLERVSRMQAELVCRYGVAAKLQRRPDESRDMHTWMEIYLAIPPGFDAILEQQMAAFDILPLIEGERRTERFWDLSPCA